MIWTAASSVEGPERPSIIVYYGTANRRVSEANGFIVPLCRDHHTGNDGVHFNKRMDLFLKRKCQEEFEKTHTREDFLKLIGRNYL